MTQTPFQRALDGYEDAIFRLSAHRRRECIDRTLAHMRRMLPSDYRRTQRYEFRRLANDGTVCQHHAVLDAVNAFPAMRDRCVVSVAQAHQQRLWWLPFLLIWNSLTSGTDVFEYAANWWLVRQRWMPRFALGWVLASLALICSDVRRMQASGSRVPSWCLAWRRAPVVGLKVCAWRIGWLQGWQWLRRKADTASPQDQPDYSFLPSALRVALAALALCAVLWPQHADAHVMTAAIGATTAWQVQTDGSDTNGGGYSSGGTDYSQQAAAQVSVTDAVANGTTTVTSATASFTSAMVGNVCYVQGGTGSITAGWYQVASYTNSTTIVLDRSTGLSAGTGVTLNLGGAFASIGRVGAVAVASNTGYVKSGSYSITSASTGVSGGCFSNSTAMKLEGFGSARGDLGTPPVLTASGISTFVAITPSAINGAIRNITIDGASLTSSRGVNQTAGCYLVWAKNCTNNGFYGATEHAPLLRCRASGCTTGGDGAITIRRGSAIGCESYSNSQGGFQDTTSPGCLSFCLAWSNSGASVDGFGFDNGQCVAVNCVAYGNGRHGYFLQASGYCVINCIAEGNGGYGLNVTQLGTVYRFAAYNNTSGATTGTAWTIDSVIAGSGSFFTNAASGDFSLNNTAGAGALLRATGFPGVLPGGTTTGYIDIGAAQHQESASASYTGGIFGG